MKRFFLIIGIVILFLCYLIVLIIRTVIELLRRIVTVVCEFFDEVLDGVEEPYLKTRNKLSAK